MTEEEVTKAEVELLIDCLREELSRQRRSVMYENVMAGTANLSLQTEHFIVTIEFKRR